jgi:hypothetical protein
VRLSWRRRLSVYAGLGAIAIALLNVAGTTAAGAQTVAHTFPGVVCDANLNGTIIHQAQDVTVGFIAPDTVAPGEVFTITFPGGSALLPNTSNGLTITNYSNLSLTYQINNATFVAGSIVNPGTATLVPTAPPNTPVTITETATLPTANRISIGTPGPFVPGTLTTPDITVQGTAPASGSVTLNAFQLTTTVKLNGSIIAAVTCAIPTDILVTIPVVAGGSSTTGSSSTASSTASSTTASSTASSTTTSVPASSTTASTASSTTTSVPASSTTASTASTSTTASTTTTSVPEETTSTTVAEQGSTTTSTLPPIEQVKIHGSATNVNNCTSILRPVISLVEDGTSTVTIDMSSDASPQPHLGDPITLSNTKVTVKVPPDLLIMGYNFGILTNGQVIPASLDLTIAGSNTTEGTHAFATLHSNSTLVVHDPDHTPGTGDETADPLSVTASLSNTLWHPSDVSKPVFFSQKSAVIKATVPIGDTDYISTQTCATKNVASFVAISANGVEAPTTVPTGSPVTAAASTTTTVAAQGPSTLPRTGASVVIWLVIAAVFLDLGAVAIVGTRRRAQHFLHR